MKHRVMMQDNLPHAIELNAAHLVEELTQALQATLFSCTGRITPRRVKQIAQEMAEAFIQFAQGEDPAVTRAYGQQLAQEGIGHRAALSLSEAVRRACWESVNPGLQLLPASGRYVGALLEGYMAEREALLLQEQERTRQAAERAQTHNR